MQLQVGVKALIKFDNKFLLLLNNPEIYPEFQKWSIPGGRIESGISLLENLQREIKEEIGVDLDLNNSRLIDAVDILKPDKHVVRLTYLIEVNKQIQIVLSKEHIQYKWMNINEIRFLSNLDKYLLEIINKFDNFEHFK